MSDNGASAEITVRDDGHDRMCPPWLGGLAPLPGARLRRQVWRIRRSRRHKTWVHEGGIATPLIAHWPRGINGRGELRHDPGHLIDIAPDNSGGRRRAEFIRRGKACPRSCAARNEPGPGVCSRWQSPASLPVVGRTKGTARFVSATGSSSRPGTSPGSFITWPSIVPKRKTSRRKTKPERKTLHSGGSSIGTSLSRSRMTM